MLDETPWMRQCFARLVVLSTHRTDGFGNGARWTAVTLLRHSVPAAFCHRCHRVPIHRLLRRIFTPFILIGGQENHDTFESNFCIFYCAIGFVLVVSGPKFRGCGTWINYFSRLDSSIILRQSAEHNSIKVTNQVQTPTARVHDVRDHSCSATGWVWRHGASRVQRRQWTKASGSLAREPRRPSPGVKSDSTRN
jgi:hypothetical protein